jgi:ABC-type antimicrobial peptide transport system permease subunit
VSPTVFIPLAQVPAGLLTFTNKLMPMNWLIRVSGEPLAYSQSIRNELLAVDSELASSSPRSLSQVLSASLSQQKMQTALLGSFSVAALLLGAIGLYGVLAYSVAERKQELGIRMALGSESGQILRLVIAHGLKLTLTGILIGVAIAFALTRFMNSLLFGVSATDPRTFVAVAVLLTLVALVACYVPARRATRVDPIVALRYE